MIADRQTYTQTSSSRYSALLSGREKKMTDYSFGLQKFNNSYDKITEILAHAQQTSTSRGTEQV